MVSKYLVTEKLSLTSDWLKIKGSLFTVISRAVNLASGAVPVIGLLVFLVCVVGCCKSLLVLQPPAADFTKAQRCDILHLTGSS